MSAYRFRRVRGFALVELLVSVVVVAFGLLAVSVLQTNALRATQTAYLRAAASEFAVAFSERIRTNTADSIYVYNEEDSNYVLASAVACYLKDTSSTSLASASSVCSGAAASQRTLAASDTADMSAWLQGASTVLPQGSWSMDLLQGSSVASNIAAAACDFSAPGASNTCSLQVSVSWREPRGDAASITYTFR